MGAFNEWSANSFLAKAEERKVATVALNLLFGAACINRLNQLRYQGIRLDTDRQTKPLEMVKIKEYLR
jgi:hypothetical protein